MNAAASQKNYQNVFIVAGSLFLVATAVTMMQYKIPTIMTSVMQQFGIGASVASWLMSIFTLVGIVFALPIGGMAGKIGPKRLILAAVALTCIASVAGGFAPNVQVLLVTRALEGVALTSVIACGPLVMQQTVDPSRMGLANGIWMLGGMLGAVFGGVLTPVLYGSYGFVGLWVGYAIIAAVAGLIFAVAVKMPRAGAVGEAALEAESEGASKVGFLGQFKPYLKLNLLPFFLAFIVFQIMLLAVLSYAPTHLQQQGMDASLSGFASTLPMLLAIVSSLAFGAISDKIHRVKPLFVVGILAMAVTTPLMLNGGGMMLWIAAVIMGLLAMGVPTVVITAYPQLLGDPKLMTLGMGVLMLVQSIGQFLGSLVPSMLLGSDLTNWSLTAAVLCGLGLAGTACVLVCKFR